MSWLNDLKRRYKFRCVSCDGEVALSGEGVDHTVIDSYPATKKLCPQCKEIHDFKYAGFENLEKIGISHTLVKEEYEKNGRQAVKVGNTYMSKTKYNYLETGKIEHQYTPGYRAALEKEGEKNAHMLEEQSNTNRAKVEGINSDAHRKLDKQIAALPDGEYEVSIPKSAT